MHDDYVRGLEPGGGDGSDRLDDLLERFVAGRAGIVNVDVANSGRLQDAEMRSRSAAAVDDGRVKSRVVRRNEVGCEQLLDAGSALDRLTADVDHAGVGTHVHGQQRVVRIGFGDCAIVAVLSGDARAGGDAADVHGQAGVGQRSLAGDVAGVTAGAEERSCEAGQVLRDDQASEVRGSDVAELDTHFGLVAGQTGRCASVREELGGVGVLEEAVLLLIGAVRQRLRLDFDAVHS